MEPNDTAAKLALLRKPFEAHQISKLPKPYKADSPRGKCDVCGGFHGLPAMHLDYVGHAALTDRLLDVDPEWDWEPLALDADGLPKLDKDGGLWIKLAICGIVRLGYGDAQGKTGPNATKERIGDALRNAGMRFGIALDLWHKGDLHADETEDTPQTTKTAKPVQKAPQSQETPKSKPAPTPIETRRLDLYKRWKAEYAGEEGGLRDVIGRDLAAASRSKDTIISATAATFKVMSSDELDYVEAYLNAEKEKAA